jgi:hypothetical protein
VPILEEAGPADQKTGSGFGEERPAGWTAAPANGLAGLPFATAIALAMREAGITDEISDVFEQSLSDIRGARSDEIHRAPYAFDLEDDDGTT